MVGTDKLPPIEENVPLSELTTLGVGGPACYLACCRTGGELAALLAWARERDLEVFILGGGSNVLVSDAGFDGLVVQLIDETVEFVEQGEGVLVRAAAGADWDGLVARAVAVGLGGIECLSGIPGRVGAAPIQNVGAYGQEVSQTIEGVEVVELETGESQRLTAAECGFDYRYSHFKGRWRGRYAVTRVDFLLSLATAGAVKYSDLARRFAAGSPPTLRQVRDAVLEIRRAKSMILDADDPNRRSAGSFFVNPVVTAARVEELRQSVQGSMPAFPAGRGRVKLSAAWLIEQAGFRRGLRRGRAGLSSRHVLALINRGGATARELVALAAEVQAGVEQTFGIRLRPEPVFLGFAGDDPLADGGIG
ncbi:MAG: UDP-N-acetylmuramate dehydrogenase [Thermoanaerobaculia bacterium]